MMCFELAMTYKVDLYDKSWKIVKSVDLSNEVFGKEWVSSSLMHEYYLLQTANARVSIAHTKTRGEVAGSWKKLYKQKGTGSARVGDKRSPIRRKGWVVFGPRKERNYSKDMPKKARKLALYGLLSLKAKDKELLAFQGFDPKAPKTKEAHDLLKNIGLAWQKTLIVINEKNDALSKSFRNLPRVKYILLDYLNPYDLMHYNKILFTKDALERLNTAKK